jgi:hypothetical protein
MMVMLMTIMMNMKKLHRTVINVGVTFLEVTEQSETTQKGTFVPMRVNSNIQEPVR